MNNENNSFECELMPMSQYLSVPSEVKKYGRYHASNFWDVKGYGRNRWVVSVRIKLQSTPEVSNLTDREVIEGCLNFLNTPPPKKKYARKQPEPKYGNLTLYKGKRFKDLDVENQEKIYSVLVLVDKNKSKFFWGKGKNV